MENQLDRIEWKLDQVLAAILRGEVGSDIAGTEVETRTAHLEMPRLTTKQHAALQMLMRGASNADIARRFNVTENGAKVHVRTIAKKVGVNTRAQIVNKLLPILSTVDDNSYRLMSGGLPKDWDETYDEPDPFVGLYKRGDDDVTTEIKE